jgi:hypothetical protein
MSVGRHRFSLTPTLSLREREPSSPDFGVPNGRLLFTTAKCFSLSLRERAEVRGKARTEFELSAV